MARKLTLLLFYMLPGLLAAQNVSNKKDTSKISTDTVQQRDLIDVGRALFKIKPRQVQIDQKKKFYFSVFPVTSGIQVPGGALITSTTAGFFLGDPFSTDLSSISFTPYFNFTGRFGLPIRSNIWLKDNTWNLQGDTRLLEYPQYTWGLGGGTPEDDKFLLSYKYVRFYQSALKRITPYFFAGIGYYFDNYIDLDLNPSEASAFGNFTRYKYGTTEDQNPLSSGPTLNLLYDARYNSLNPAPGWYANIIYRYSGVAFGSNNNWQSLYIDLRKYISITHTGPKNILAFWSYFWTSLTPGTLYLNLPSIGMDPYQRSGRGIEQSRYRGQRLFYFETEFRRDITRNGLLGFVVFANVNSVSEPITNRFIYWNPAGGTGLRIKFNKKSNTNICIDYGFSKGYSAIILNLGEAF